MIWTIDKIHKLSEFGDEAGWFYGLVWDKRLYFAEIYPGIGYAVMDKRKDFDPRIMKYSWVLKDLVRGIKLSIQLS